MNETNELLLKFIQYCNNQKKANIIVEGKRDKDTLISLGISNQIFIKGGFSIYELVDQIFDSELIIILTDFDKEGKVLRQKIKREIQYRRSHGEIDSYARHLLFKFCRANKLSEIEELKKFRSLVKTYLHPQKDVTRLN